MHGFVVIKISPLFWGIRFLLKKNMIGFFHYLSRDQAIWNEHGLGHKHIISKCQNVWRRSALSNAWNVILNYFNLTLDTHKKRRNKFHWFSFTINKFFFVKFLWPVWYIGSFLSYWHWPLVLCAFLFDIARMPWNSSRKYHFRLSLVECG